MNRCLPLVLFFAALSWGAPVLSVSSYDMQNGETGTWRYLDEICSPCGSGNACNTVLAQLSGGSGKVTDGVAPASWRSFSVPSGDPVPWVGWYSIEPTITFHFTGDPVVARLGLYMDNTPRSNVFLPGKVKVNGTDYVITPDLNEGPRWIYIDLPPAN